MLSVERDGEEIPVGYFSKKLSPSEQKYSVTELECLAVVKAIDHFAVYLWGRMPVAVALKFTVHVVQSS